MKLSDVVSEAGLSHYTQIALVILFLVFVLLLLQLFVFRRRSHRWRRMAEIPLRDDSSAEVSAGESTPSAGGQR
jgi:hypothetical protein